ncbi:MAG: hypothetical protein OEM05_02535 [Myxococcales bacterium]|nr:hypothetical protein [Myxococcales bacterium]
MAYLVRRRDGRVEIREAVSTAGGPRSRTLASFRGSLSPELLQRAARRAERPFDAAVLIARAAARGVPVTDRPQSRGARELLGRLRRGEPIDPVLVTLLKEALAAVPAAPVPAPLGEVAEWIGQSDARRGEALRGLLRVADRIVRARGRVRTRTRKRFPRFRSTAREAA